MRKIYFIRWLSCYYSRNPKTFNDYHKMVSWEIKNAHNGGMVASACHMSLSGIKRNNIGLVIDINKSKKIKRFAGDAWSSSSYDPKKKIRIVRVKHNKPVKLFGNYIHSSYYNYDETILNPVFSGICYSRNSSKEIVEMAEKLSKVFNLPLINKKAESKYKKQVYKKSGGKIEKFLSYNWTGMDKYSLEFFRTNKGIRILFKKFNPFDGAFIEGRKFVLFKNTQQAVEYLMNSTQIFSYFGTESLVEEIIKDTFHVVKIWKDNFYSIIECEEKFFLIWRSSAFAEEIKKSEAAVYFHSEESMKDERKALIKKFFYGGLK